MEQKIDLKSTIFSLYIIDDKIIVACGGGHKKFGVKNKIILYQLYQGYFGQRLIEENLDEIPEFIEGIPSKKIFGFVPKIKYSSIIFQMIIKHSKKYIL